MEEVSHAAIELLTNVERYRRQRNIRFAQDRARCFDRPIDDRAETLGRSCWDIELHKRLHWVVALLARQPLVKSADVFATQLRVARGHFRIAFRNKPPEGNSGCFRDGVPPLALGLNSTAKLFHPGFLEAIQNVRQSLSVVDHFLSSTGRVQGHGDLLTRLYRGRIGRLIGDHDCPTSRGSDRLVEPG